MIFFSMQIIMTIFNFKKKQEKKSRQIQKGKWILKMSKQKEKWKFKMRKERRLMMHQMDIVPMKMNLFDLFSLFFTFSIVRAYN